MQSKWLLEKITACFDRLSMNGVVSLVFKIPPFALSLSKGKRQQFLCLSTRIRLPCSFCSCRIFSLEDRYCPRRNERMESNDKSFPKLLGVDVPQTDSDQRPVTLIHRGLISGYPAPRGSVCRDKRLTGRRSLADIAAVFALPRLRVPG